MSDGAWVAITEADLLRPELSEEVPNPSARAKGEFTDYFFNTIGRLPLGETFRTTIDVLSHGCGCSPRHIAETLFGIGNLDSVDVRVRWDDGALCITKLGVFGAWGAFGTRLASDA